jgi:hypothetical protein
VGHSLECSPKHHCEPSCLKWRASLRLKKKKEKKTMCSWRANKFETIYFRACCE